MHIVNVGFVPTRIDDSRHQRGTVIVYLSNGRQLFFDDIQVEHVETWKASNYDLEHVPYFMQSAFGQVWATLKAEEEEAEAEAEEDEDEPEEEVDVHRALDPIGEATGIPSPRPRIRRDDALGQLTGIPSPGYAVTEDTPEDEIVQDEEED